MMIAYINSAITFVVVGLLVAVATQVYCERIGVDTDQFMHFASYGEMYAFLAACEFAAIPAYNVYNSLGLLTAILLFLFSFMQYCVVRAWIYNAYEIRDPSFQTFLKSVETGSRVPSAVSQCVALFQAVVIGSYILYFRPEPLTFAYFACAMGLFFFVVWIWNSSEMTDPEDG